MFVFLKRGGGDSDRHVRKHLQELFHLSWSFCEPGPHFITDNNFQAIGFLSTETLLWCLTELMPLLLCDVGTNLNLSLVVLAQPIGGGASQWYEVFTINCVFQHIPQLKTEQSAQGEKCWKIRFSGCCWIKGEMHDRWEGLAPSPLLVGHIPAEQISDTQPFKKSVRLPLSAVGNV